MQARRTALMSELGRLELRRARLREEMETGIREYWDGADHRTAEEILPGVDNAIRALVRDLKSIGG